MKWIYGVFFRGILGILPLILSIYFLIWFFKFLEKFLDNTIFYFYPAQKVVPGLGIAAGVVIIFCIGLLLSSRRISRFYKFLQRPLKNIPLVKSIYSAIEDLMMYFSKGQDNQGKKVVIVDLPDNEMELIGLVTNTDLDNIDSQVNNNDRVAVFIPMSYALGGYTIFVPQKYLRETSMNVEVFMKSALTAWMKKVEK
jgi:uncharacterized membrane protein